MPKRALIRKGDRTTHGGTVLAGDPTFLIDGRELARVGDPVQCPQCRGTYPITTGAHDMHSDAPVARHDDLTACGAKLIASQNSMSWSDEAADASDEPPPAVAAQSDDDEQPHAIRFRALDPDSGQPVPNCVYLLTRENGIAHGGVTDADGFTEVIEAPRAERIAVHFQFQAPNGKQIEREDLA